MLEGEVCRVSWVVEGQDLTRYTLYRRGGRVVECGGLENRYVGNPGVEGSNPSLSAPRKYLPFLTFLRKEFRVTGFASCQSPLCRGCVEDRRGGSSRGDLVGFAFGGMGH